LRPALIVGHVSGPDLILAFITSRMARGDPQVECLLTPADAEFPTTSLKVP
jgi:hypothetical protein